MRNAMMAVGLNRSASRLEADSSSASSVPATTTTAPRSASRRRQRFRTRRMTSTSSARRSDAGLPSDMSAIARGHLRVDTPAGYTPDLRNGSTGIVLVSRQPVRDDRLGRQQQQAGEQQVPPEALPSLGLLRASASAAAAAWRRRWRRAAGHRRDEFGGSSGARSDSAGSRFTAMRSGRPRCCAAGADLVDALLGQLERCPARSPACVDPLAGRRHDHAVGAALEQRGRDRRPGRPCATTAAARTARGSATSWWTSGRYTGLSARSFHESSSVVRPAR